MCFFFLPLFKNWALASEESSNQAKEGENCRCNGNIAKTNIVEYQSNGKNKDCT
jgi:hypothetical protein